VTRLLFIAVSTQVELCWNSFIAHVKSI